MWTRTRHGSPRLPAFPPLLTLPLVTLLALAAPQVLGKQSSDLAGLWVVNPELSHEAQPNGPTQRSIFDKLPNASVSVGGMPLPGTGNASLPSAPGNPRDPKVLRCAELTIEPKEETLRLDYAAAGSETLAEGNDQGLVSHWSRRKLTTRYETSTRKVSQTYEVRRDGRLLVTVKINPNDGPTLIHKRVFERTAAEAGATPTAADDGN